ncbi:hypothetical protein BH10PSE15_BH10PSE15_03280 [soil metagenome]
MADIDPIGSRTRVNAYQRSTQTAPSTTKLSDGSLVVVWQSYSEDGSGWGVYAQRYDAAGHATGGEFLVNSSTASDQYAPEVAAVGTGFVITWRDDSAEDGSASSIRARAFAADGTPQGLDFRVNTDTSNYQYTPTIAGSATQYVVAWNTNDAGEDGSGSAIRYQLYAADGTATGLERTANTTVTGNQLDGRAAMASDGSFVLAWTDYGAGDAEVVVQKFNADGSKSGDEIRSATGVSGNQTVSSIAYLSGGSIVVGYTDDSLDGNSQGAFARIIETDGSFTDVLLNQGTDGAQNDPQVVALAGGGFYATWYSSQYQASTGSYNNIFGRTFDANGAATQDETVAIKPAYYYYNQANPAAVALDDGRIALVAASDGLDPVDTSTGISLQFVGPSGAAAPGTLALENIVSSVTFLENAANATPQLIEPGIRLNAGAGTNYVGGTVRVDALAGWETDDHVVVRNFGSGTGQIGVAGTTVSYAGVAIGTLDAATAATPLLLHLNSAATTAAVQALLAAIGYTTTTNSPGAQTRSISFAVSAADGTSSGNQLVEIGVTPQPDGIAPTGGETVINTYKPDRQEGATVTALADGGHVTFWQSYNEDGSSAGVYGQRYSANGAANGAQFQVNDQTFANQYEISAAGLAGGGFVVTYRDEAGDGSGYGVYQRLFGADGKPVGASMRVNVTTDSSQYTPNVVGVPGGGYIVAWVSDNQDGSGSGIYLRRYDANGTPLDATERLVNVITDNYQYDPQIAVASDGSFVVVFRSDNTDSYGAGVFGQRFAADGTALGTEFQINHTTLYS